MKVTIKLDLEKDAWNWWDACNRISHGVDWKTRIDERVAEKITGKTKKEAYKFLLPYLKKFHQKNNSLNRVKSLQKGFDKKREEIFSTLERITSRKIYRNNFTCFLTSFPRFPYDYKKGYVWISSRKPLSYQIQIFAHELLHFQFFEYYGEKVWEVVGPKKYQYIKEGVTIILDDELKHLTSAKEETYEIYKPLSRLLLKEWRQNKDFEKLIEKGIEILKKQPEVYSAN